ncbi:MAG: Asp-tRNA(Asn)/Glu-tRNA(Gln) amidotransferase subunit GatB [Candidatus Bipolaricaulota bacterium]
MDVAIGLEIHVQLATKSKLFCGCSAEYFGAAPNSLTCPVCLGLPGTLPVLNRRAVELTLRLALALGSEVQPISSFDRKSYFYPDLPKGYQITQKQRPLALGGALSFPGEAGEETVCVGELHLEEDAGKLIHAGDRTLVDLNRSGIALLEIVTEPDLRSPHDARVFVQTLRMLLRHLKVSSGEMDKGALRCDANVSLVPDGGPPGCKTEIKNMNSTRAVERALAAEAERQWDVLSRGQPVEHATYGWDEARGTVVLQRTKEEAANYRHFPEPDLPPLEISSELVRLMQGELPELPQARLERWNRELGLSGKEGQALIAEPERGEYFEEVVAACDSPREAANWLLTELLPLWTGIKPPVPAAGLGTLIRAVNDGVLSRTTGKSLLEQAVTTGADLEQLVGSEEVRQLSDTASLTKLAQETISSHPQAAADYRSGRTQALGFLVGQAMRKVQGRADAARLRKLLARLLDEGADPPAT